MPPTHVSVDGRLVEPAAATVPATDDGLLRGDGVFEALRLYGGRPFALEDHLARMRRSADGLRLDVDLDAVRRDVATVLDAAGAVDAVLRLVVTRGGLRLAFVEPLPAHEPTVALATVEYAPSRLLDAIKSLSYAANMLANRIAAEQGAGQALLTTPHGRILEGPTSSFFCVLEEGGPLVTPPLSEHVLDSITRRRLLGLVEVREEVLRTTDLPRMREAFLASTTREVHAVARIDDTELPAAPGPRTTEAARAFRAHVEAELGATA
ncbi:aminotransferase class IV [Conexibacter sp. SYSU D00693]|uniref:aminotransferase class IV n=1 Tax=Conexibacter sp. SYSU D00693 TaxID=2812560 RepID=UPI00196B3622|nr:aminotransferase class IV [Conexibacter sp. SYSU D00693]